MLKNFFVIFTTFLFSVTISLSARSAEKIALVIGTWAEAPLTPFVEKFTAETGIEVDIQTFPFRDLHPRVVFILVESSNTAGSSHQTGSSTGGYRNDVELLATAQLKAALISCGVPSDEIMLLSAYALQAHRLQGLHLVHRPVTQGGELKIFPPEQIAVEQKEDQHTEAQKQHQRQGPPGHAAAGE